MDEKSFYAKIMGIKSPWFIAKVAIDDKNQIVHIYIDHEPHIQAQCPDCKRFYSVYDHMPERAYRHLDTCQMKTIIHIRLPRVNCPIHGPKAIDSEYGENQSSMSVLFEQHVLSIAQECSIETVCQICDIKWDACWLTVQRAVNRGMMRKPHKIPERICVDEKSFARGHKYETIVTDETRSVVDYVCDDREQTSLEKYYKRFSEKERASVKTVCMDMWDSYIAATKEYIPDAERKIVFDRYHVMKYINDAVDSIRKSEHNELMEKGDERLKGTKYDWLTAYDNMPQWRRNVFDTIRKSDLKVTKAWSIKENARHLWDYHSEGWMRRYFNAWYGWATRSRLAPMKKAAKTLANHIDNIVTYATHNITNAISESLNAKIEKVKRIACGYRNRDHYKLSIYFHCGGLDLLPYPPKQPTIRFRPC